MFKEGNLWKLNNSLPPYRFCTALISSSGRSKCSTAVIDDRWQHYMSDASLPISRIEEDVCFGEICPVMLCMFVEVMWKVSNLLVLYIPV
jgi:hypothetical protein